MTNVIEIPAITLLDKHVGEEVTDNILNYIKTNYGSNAVDQLFSLHSISDIKEFVNGFGIAMP